MKTIAIVLLSCFLCQPIIARHQNARVPSKEHLRKDKPTVYIEFERAGDRAPLRSGESNNGIWLRLHNNTKWPIVLDMQGAPSKEYGDALLIYDELSGRRVTFERNCHVCSFNALGSGHSLLFSVPAEHLSKGLGIRIKFSYGWEDYNKVLAGQEPEHYVYFYSSQLPLSTQQSSK